MGKLSGPGERAARGDKDQNETDQKHIRAIRSSSKGKYHGFKEAYRQRGLVPFARSQGGQIRARGPVTGCVNSTATPTSSCVVCGRFVLQRLCYSVWLESLKCLLSGPFRKRLQTPDLKGINEGVKQEVVSKDTDKREKIIPEVEVTLARNL